MHLRKTKSARHQKLDLLEEENDVTIAFVDLGPLSDAGTAAIRKRSWQI